MIRHNRVPAQAAGSEVPLPVSEPVDRSSPLPYYVHVREALRERIEHGYWKAGDQLPAESELCQAFAVSRTVIRQALQELRYAGLVVREKGRGTFVAEPKIPESLFQRLTGFYEDMAARGHIPYSQVLKQDVIPATPKIARYLNLEPNTPVICIERLRFVQAEPIVLVTSYLPYALCPDLLHEDLTRQSLYACLERKFGLVIARGHRSLEAVQANEDQAHLLRIPAGAALIMLDSVGYLSDGTALEYYHALYRGDRSRFEVELIRMHEPAAAGATTGDQHVYLQEARIVTQTNGTTAQA